MVLSGITGTPVATQIPEMPKVQPQLVEERKEEKAEKSMSTEQYVRNYFSDIPIMAEVSRCESSFRQTNTNGKVLRGLKNNKDVGVMQVNEYFHLQTAKKMNIDLHTLDGNLAYARHLYDKKGTRDWMPSSPCWSKSEKLAQRVGEKVYE